MISSWQTAVKHLRGRRPGFQAQSGRDPDHEIPDAFRG
jgi:hypothetical protein